MKNQRHLKLHFAHIISLIAISFSLVTGMISRAQDDQHVITLGIPEYFLTQFKDSIVPHLEQANPDIRINLVTISTSTKAPDTAGMEDYYKQINAEVNAADVLLLTALDVTPEATRAGYFLDLKPLIDVDVDLDIGDFVPAAWNAYQWDGSTWALPALYSTRFLVYDTAVFDQAGLTYPSAAWTMEELATAARQLTVPVSDGKPGVPGLYLDTGTLAVMFRALIGEPLYDSTVQPVMPHYARPDLASLLETWAALEAEGSTTTQPDGDTYDKIPLRVGSAFDFDDRRGDSHLWAGSLLPGNTSVMDTFGLAVSKGTRRPDLSYQVVKILTEMPEMRALLGGGSSSRSSVQAMSAEAEYQLHLTNDERAFVDSTTNVSLNAADMLFANYLAEAINRVKTGEDAPTALQAVEAQANQIMQAAEDMHDSVVVVVPTPIPDGVPDGKIALTFGIFTGNTTLPNPLEWKKAVDEFIATDPQVGKIKLEFVAPVTSDWSKKIDALPTTTDCFFPAGITNVDHFGDRVLSLDALLDADPSFARDDVLNGVLRELERDHEVKGYPLSITPTMLRYNIQQFEAAGLELPTDGWTVDQFASALTALKAQNPAQPVLYPNYDSGQYLLMLMAAYGALPVDWRTDPVTINYTEPKVVEVIQQVLDLAKNDTIRYTKTAAFMFTRHEISAPLVIENFLSFTAPNDTSGLTTFPSGTAFAPISYGLNAAFISADTPAPEACYRWLRNLTQYPKLFSGIPALRSAINDPRTEALFGSDAVATFKRFDAALSAPNAIIVNDGLDVARMWLMRAFDNYVLNNADLTQELADAERFTKEYMACVTALGSEADKALPGTIFVEDTCVEKIDPTFMDIFSAHG